MRVNYANLFVFLFIENENKYSCYMLFHLFSEMLLATTEQILIFAFVHESYRQ